MKRASLTVSLLVFVSSLIVAFLVLPEDTTARVLHVGGTGPDNYTSMPSRQNDAMTLMAQ